MVIRKKTIKPRLCNRKLIILVRKDPMLVAGKKELIQN
jgi:hypothetical protein